MAVMPRSSPFGSRSRTGVLLALFLLGQSYPREMSRVLGTGLSAVQKALAGLERDGLVAGRTIGRTRVFTLNPRYFAAAALRTYLARLAQPESELERRVSALRRRPRVTGKPL